MTFAERLKVLRESQQLSRQALADATGLSVHSISSYENGRREPNSKALTILENYFQVSGAYLRGESEDRARPAAAWEDTEIMEAVRESLPKQLAGLNGLLKDCTAQEQKETFDILVELGHVLTIEDSCQRVAGMELIQSVFAASTRFIDVCAGAQNDIDPKQRPWKEYRHAMKSYSEALRKSFFSSK